MCVCVCVVYAWITAVSFSPSSACVRWFYGFSCLYCANMHVWAEIFTVRGAREGRLNHYDGILPFTSKR